MAGFAKGILIAMIAAVAMIIMMNVAFFFPWYITVIETGFEVSQIVANENYLPADDYQNIYGELKSKPIFNKRTDPSKLYIKVTHENGKNGIESGSRGADYYYNKAESQKPYVQKGNLITVKIGASYPFQMKLGNGREIVLADIPVEIPIKTAALKYYKDLPYYIDN